MRRPFSNDALLVHIKAIHAETHGSYGWPRTWKELLVRGIRVDRQEVQQLMQLHGIRAKGKRRLQVTGDSNHDLPTGPNRLIVSSPWPHPTGSDRTTSATSTPAKAGHSWRW